MIKINDKTRIQNYQSRMGEFCERDYLTTVPLGVLILNIIMVGLSSANILHVYDVATTLTRILFYIITTVFIVQAAFALLYFNHSFRVKFKKMQATFVSISMFIFSNILYYVTISIWVVKDYPEFILQTVLYIFLGGIFSFIYYVVRAFRSINKKSINRMYNFPRNVLHLIVPVVYVVTGYYLAYVNNQSSFDIHTEAVKTVGIILTLACFIQYLLSIVFAEFVLYTYLIFKYPEIMIEADKADEKKTINVKKLANTLPNFLVTIVIKTIQYSLLAFVAIGFPFGILPQAIIIGTILMVVFVYFLLKWICLYKIGGAGKYYINAMLVIMTAAVIPAYIEKIANQSMEALNLEWVLAVGAILSIFLWANVNIIALLKRKGKREDIEKNPDENEQ
ncbi:hypothetical protein [Paenibacillus sp. L3-i20]|uniref:hypothetical protein n=1 Tax=Paenibacillus sp. L3-i20 TaxID=2905833 RepID=UPI001EDE9C8A|nr:hypothetical protein [Paenibacillus sp. L3-i20]GKU77589.1 hypothetical protein L3i20_v219860 [Paenibacillus sp. L3-i20]